MEASKSLTDGSFGSTPGSCRNKELLLGAKHIAYHSTNQCGQWQKEEHCPPYKHWWVSLQKLPIAVLKKSPLQLPPFNNTATNTFK